MYKTYKHILYKPDTCSLHFIDFFIDVVHYLFAKHSYELLTLDKLCVSFTTNILHICNKNKR